MELEKKAKQEALEREKQEKIQKAEEEKKARIERLENEKKLRTERIEKEKAEKIRIKEEAAAEKERIAKALEEERLRKKPDISKFLFKSKEEPKEAQVPSQSQQDLNVQLNEWYSQYGIVTQALKQQKLNKSNRSCGFQIDRKEGLSAEM